MSWTLENARKDYRNTNPVCSYCKFYEYKLDLGLDMYSVDRDIHYCKVKEKEVGNLDKTARKCIYYTVKI
ncbi:hypothetical protein [Clostridium sp.]|uniref:hypothetical protein n=1 Tax=Clostridium sp. TaxID=1506 RepID=UPI003F675B38